VRKTTILPARLQKTASKEFRKQGNGTGGKEGGITQAFLKYSLKDLQIIHRKTHKRTAGVCSRRRYWWGGKVSKDSKGVGVTAMCGEENGVFDWRTQKNGKGVKLPLHKPSTQDRLGQ